MKQPATIPDGRNEILSQRLRDLIDDILEARSPNAGVFCGNCYHPLSGETEACRHCGMSIRETPPVEAIPLEVIEMHRRRRGREGLVVRTIAWGGLTIGVIVALLPFVFGDVTVLTAILFFGLMAMFYIGSANLANSVGDSLGYKWGRSLFEQRWREFVRERDGNASQTRSPPPAITPGSGHALTAPDIIGRASACPRGHAAERREKAMFQRLAILSAVVVALGVAAGAVVVSAKSSAPPGGSVAAVDQAGPAAKGTMPANFRIEIDGIPVSTFERVALGSEIEVIEFLPGDGGPAIKVPGDASYRNIVLLTSPDNPALQPLWEWHNSIIEGGIDRRDGTIVALDRDGTEIARYNFFDGWPSKWEIPDIPVDGPDIAVEVIELAVEKVERE